MDSQIGSSKGSSLSMFRKECVIFFWKGGDGGLERGGREGRAVEKTTDTRHNHRRQGRREENGVVEWQRRETITRDGATTVV